MKKKIPKEGVRNRHLSLWITREQTNNISETRKGLGGKTVKPKEKSFESQPSLARNDETAEIAIGYSTEIEEFGIDRETKKGRKNVDGS